MWGRVVADFWTTDEQAWLQTLALALSLTHGTTSLQDDYQRADDYPLHRAVVFGYKAQVMSLLQAQDNINARDFYGATPLMLACAVGDEELVNWLLARKAFFYWQDRFGFNACTYAVVYGQLSIVRLLLRAYPQAKLLRDGYDMTLSMRAAYHGQTALFDFLLHHEELFMQCCARYDDYTVSHFAAESGHTSIVNSILSTSRLAVDVWDRWGRTPLMIAVIMNKFDVVSLCVSYHASLDARWHRGMNALAYALCHGHERLVWFLYNCYSDKKPWSDLVIGAIGYGQVSICKKLFACSGFYVNTVINGETLLMLAAKVGQAEVIDLLLPFHPCAEVINAEGHTALTLAVMARSVESVTKLLHYMVCRQDAFLQMLTAFQLACDLDFSDVIACFHPFMAEPDNADQAGSDKGIGMQIGFFAQDSEAGKPVLPGEGKKKRRDDWYHLQKLSQPNPSKRKRNRS